MKPRPHPPRIPLPCGDPAAAQVAPNSSSAAHRAHTTFYPRNGRVSEERFSVRLHIHEPRSHEALDLRTDCADRRVLGLVFWSHCFPPVGGGGVLLCGQRRGNVFLGEGPQFGEFCGCFSAGVEAPVRIRRKHKDVSASLRVFWGAFGLQSTEKGPVARHHPGMDSPTVSPVKG